MTVAGQIRDEKLQYDINNGTEKNIILIIRQK